MNARMRADALPSSTRGATSTSTSAEATGVVALADGEQAGHPAERSADERRMLAARTRRPRGRRRRSARGCRRRRATSRCHRGRAGRPSARTSRWSRAGGPCCPTRGGSGPPPWRRTTGGSSGSPKASAASVTSSAAGMRMRPTLPSRGPRARTGPSSGAPAAGSALCRRWDRELARRTRVRGSMPAGGGRASLSLRPRRAAARKPPQHLVGSSSRSRSSGDRASVS